MAERDKRKERASLVVCKCDRPMYVYFSREVIEEREMFRRLAHRVVDLAVDSGQQRWLGGCVAFTLERIGRDHVIKMVTDLVHEVWADDS